MGELVNDMARLHEKISALNENRRQFFQNLAQETQERCDKVSQMLSDFQTDRITIAQEAQANRCAFLNHVRCEIEEMQAGLSKTLDDFQKTLVETQKTHIEAAKNQKDNLLDFLTNCQNTVGQQLEESARKQQKFADVLADAHSVWCGIVNCKESPEACKKSSEACKESSETY